ncbi:MAG: hypothetical protein IPN50_14260 [Sphingomonadales bacterium]|nr:hypothetical protein [Sphingomonadales bacterium]
MTALPTAADRNGPRSGRCQWWCADPTIRSSGLSRLATATLNELYRPFRLGADATAANEALTPETIKVGEAGQA